MNDDVPKLQQECKNKNDQKGGRTPYGYHEGRYIGPHEEVQTDAQAEFNRRVQHQLRRLKIRRANEDRGRDDYGRERTLER